MKYEFVTRSIPTLWKGCYLLLARALPPVVFMDQPLRSVRCFLAHSTEFWLRGSESDQTFWLRTSESDQTLTRLFSFSSSNVLRMFCESELSSPET
jgi:hypothetical protein